MAQYIVYAAADALGEGRDGTEGGNELAQLCAVEDDADGLVAQQAVDLRFVIDNLQLQNGC